MFPVGLGEGYSWQEAVPIWKVKKHQMAYQEIQSIETVIAWLSQTSENQHFLREI